MGFFYFLGIQFYVLSVRIASLFNAKARLWVRGRRGWRKNLKSRVSKNEKYVWVHCASLGEFEQGRPLIEAIKEKYKDVKIVLSFFSPSGYEVRKNYTGADIIVYLPADTPWNARFFCKTVNPQFAVFVKYEFWYYYLSELKKKKVPLFLVSAIFRKDQVFFRWYGKWYQKMLQMFNRIFVQDTGSLELLKEVRVESAIAAGDTRFDRVWEIYNNRKNIEILDQFSENAYTIVCGSTWQPDEEILLEWLQNAPGDVKLVVAPHEINEHRIHWIETHAMCETVRFSNSNGFDLKQKRILIIDNIGMLSSLYGYGKVAYIGGAFGKGLHNTLEAAVYGMPVVFGPSYAKFAEAAGLVAAGAGFPVSGYGDLKKIMDLFYNDEIARKKASAVAGNFVRMKVGATSIFMDFLEKS